MVNRFNAKTIGANIVNKITQSFLLRIHAEEGAEPKPTPTAPNPEPQQASKPQEPAFNLEDLLAKVRKEEKEKLYPRLKKSEDELRVITEANNANLLKVAELQTKIDELKATDKSADTIKTLQGQIDALTQQLEEAKNAIPDENSIRQKLEEEYKVKLYVQEQLTAHKDSILSVFRGEVTGNTIEEVDQAIKNAVEKTNTAKKELGGNAPAKETTSKKQSNPPAVAPPNSTGSGLEIDAEYIRNLDPASQEYAELRQKLGLR